MDLSGFVSSGFSGVQSWASGFSSFLKTLLSTLADTIKQTLKALAGALKRIARGVLDALKALLHGNWRQFWHDLKAAWDTLRKWAKQIHDTVFGPLDQIRKTIQKLYDTFWKPVLTVIDSMRHIVSVVGIFDRKLAAKLDQRLWNLEGKLLAPITTLYKRLNSISSYFRAILTTLGLLDRALLVESIRRDCSIIWHVLMNPTGKQPPPATPGHPRTAREVNTDYQEFVARGTGAYEPPIAHAVGVYNDTLRELS